MCRLPFGVNEGGIDDVFEGVFLVGVFVAVILLGFLVVFCFVFTEAVEFVCKV